MAEKKKHFTFSDTQLILLGFLGAIFVGSILLTLPAASAEGESTDYLTALFTAVTSVCVTGLTVVDTFSHWSLFGQIIILILIQLGGLGIIAFVVGSMLIVSQRISLDKRMLLENAFNLNTVSGIPAFLKKVFLGTFIIEFAGGLLCLPVFLRDFGSKGIFMAFFHSVSAFCNAGLDIIGDSSLVPYATDVWLNIVTILLIILGGIGFIVWFDVIYVIKKIRAHEIAKRFFFRSLSLHSKITLYTTGILILFGWVFFLIGEWNNPNTFGTMNFFEKLLAGLFQSVTTRTAGFASVPQGELTSSSYMVTIILMFIGGSSVGTAGGVKTSTVALIFLCALTVIRGRSNVTAFKRIIPRATVQRAIAVFLIGLMTLLGAVILMTFLYEGDFRDIFYEVASALGTAGLSCGVSAQTGTAARILLIICMYLGRVGPISLALALAGRSKREIFYSEQDITIG